MTKKMPIPWELKYNFIKGMLTTFFKGVIYEFRKRFGGVATLEFVESVWKREDRVKKMTTTLKDVFKIEGNNIETLQTWWKIYNELLGMNFTILELSKTHSRVRYPTGCAWVTEPEDISDWFFIFSNIINTTINPKATMERVKGICEGEPYCEYVWKIEE